MRLVKARFSRPVYILSMDWRLLLFVELDNNSLTVFFAFLFLAN